MAERATSVATATLWPEQVQRLDRHFAGKAERGVRAGYVMMIAHRDGVAHASALGHRDLASGQKMTLDTRFRIASLTKPLVSMAVIRLHEQGRLQLIEPVSKYLPEFGALRVGVSLDAAGGLETAPAKRPITIFDLLSHTAGLGAGGRAHFPATRTYVERYDQFFKAQTLAESCSWIADLPLTFQPGEDWGYSFSLEVLARIVEIRTGAPIGEAMQLLVFGPLGMTDTAYNGAGADRSRLATIYESRPDGALARVEGLVLDELAYPMSGGGLISTGPDYLRFLRMMLGEGVLDGRRILSTASVHAMTRNVLPASQRPIRLELPMFEAGFGLGFGVIVEEPASPSLLAPGDYFWAGATDTFFFVSPSRRIAGLILSQYWSNEHTREWSTMFDFAAMASAAALS